MIRQRRLPLHSIGPNHQKMAISLRLVVLLFLSSAVQAGHYELVGGADTDVCNAYRRNFEVRQDDLPMACERTYDPAIAELSLPKWRKLDFKKHFGLYKKIVVYLNSVPRAEGTSLSPTDLRQRLKQLDFLPVDQLQTEFYLGHFDLGHNGQKIDVLAMRRQGCGPHREPGQDDTSLFAVNRTLTDLDYRRMNGWRGSSVHATIALFKGKPYIERYEPNDNWGHLLSGSGRLYVLAEESRHQTLTTICEIRFVPDSAPTR